MSSQIVEQMNALIPHVIFQGEGEYLTTKSVNCSKCRFTFVYNLTFDAQEKISSKNSMRKRVSSFV